MAGDNHAIGPGEDWVREAELRDRGGDLRDLLVRVGARVAGVGEQFAVGHRSILSASQEEVMPRPP